MVISVDRGHRAGPDLSGQACGHAGFKRLYESWTALEQEAMQQVIGDLLNKQVAAEVNITKDTVKFHRGNVMRKWSRFVGGPSKDG
jgi:FixJ family two-component response regulator